MMEPDCEDGPQKKKIRLSVEVLPETRIEKFEGEIEEHEKLETPEDRFMAFVRQLDFLGKEKATKPIPESETKWAKVRQKVDVHLGRAHAEINQMVDLLNMLKTQPYNLDLIPCQRPPPTEKRKQDSAMGQVAFKKAQLRKASDRLAAAALALETDSNRYQQYLQDADKLRQNWKVGCPTKAVPNDYSPIFNLDFTYKNDGSKVRNLPPTTILRADGTQGAQVKIPIDQLSRTLIISNDTTSTAIPIVYPIENKAFKATTCTYTGFEEVHQMFLNAQESLFTWEIFDTLTKAAQKSKRAIYSQQEGELKLEGIGDELFSVKLLTQKVVDGEILAPEIPPKQKTFRYGFDFMFQTIGVMLHTEIRKKHKKKMEDDHRPKLTRDFFRETPNTEEAILTNLMALYDHFQAYGFVLQLLGDMKAKHPGFSYRSVGTDSPFISSFDLYFNGSLMTFLSIRKDQISTTTIDMIPSPHQLEQSLEILIRQYK